MLRLTTDEDKKALELGIKTIVDAKLRVSSENSLINRVKGELIKKFGGEKKDLDLVIKFMANEGLVEGEKERVEEAAKLAESLDLGYLSEEDEAIAK